MWMKTWMILMAGVVVVTAAGATPTENVLYKFCSAPHCSDGTHPITTPVADAAGNLYGTAGDGKDAGWIFELDRSTHQETVLYTFCSLAFCADGRGPNGLTVDSQGNLYGTTFGGGASNHGAVYELTPSNGAWTYNLLYSFAGGSDGTDPESTLIVDGAGSLYGTTAGDGSFNNPGTVFELMPSESGWTESVLYTFNGSNPNDGFGPVAGLILDHNGNLYGTTVGGGTYSFGTVFELTPTNGGWTEHILYVFCSQANCADGGNPRASLVLDRTGNLYSTTSIGGGAPNEGEGAAFELAPSNGSWTETVLHGFCLEGGACPDGSSPIGGLTFDKTGNLFGTTLQGGIDQCGTAFKLAPSNGNWVFRKLTFHPLQGCGLYSGLLLGPDSLSLYGTTWYGGHGGGFGFGNGVIFKIQKDSMAWR